MALTKIIAALGNKNFKGDPFVGFRDSKLTWFLKPYLSGNSRTAIICTVNPDKKYTSESV